ncbi:MAG: molecular chaperone DnaJ [Polyangiales bacterium]
MEERRDLYEVLGLSRTCSTDEVRKAYRQAALKHHPDRNEGDASATARFKEATEAFQVLSSDEKRAVYDQYGFAGLDSASSMGGGVDLGDVFGNFQDLFSEFFGGAPNGRARGQRGPQRGPDLRVGERLSLHDAAFGCKREIGLRFPAPCDNCGGSGAAPGTEPVRCTTCRGSGQVSNSRGFVMFTAPCPTCRGEGRLVKTPCPNCNGQGQRERTKKIVVTFPAGIDQGQMLRVSGQGISGPQGGPPGDVLVQVEIEPDPRFERHGAELATRAKVPFVDAALGTKLDVPTLDGTPLSVDVPPGTQPGHVIVVRNHGVPRLEGKGRNRGSLHIVVEVTIPTEAELNPAARELLEKLRVALRKQE